MAIGREPSAWVNAARMDTDFNGVYLYVEGESDESFWKKFVNTNNVRICVCHGCEVVILTIETHQKAQVKKYLGVIDRDFRDFLGTMPNNHDIVVTDCHDIEMMMYNSDAYRNLIISIDRQNKLGEYESQNGSVLQYVLFLTNRIGYTKLASKKEGELLEFRREKNYELVVPKYEGMLDADGKYQGDERLARIINAFSSQNTKLVKLTDSQIIDLMHREMKNKIDNMILSNGHDVSYLMPHVLRKKCRFNKSGLDKSMIDSILMAAYSKEMFHDTDLYQAMVAWSKDSGSELWIDDTAK